MTLASLFEVIADPEERLFIMHRLGPHECEAVAEGTAAELRATRCVEVCGAYEIEALALAIDDTSNVFASAPVLIVTLAKKEAPSC